MRRRSVPSAILLAIAAGGAMALSVPPPTAPSHGQRRRYTDAAFDAARGAGLPILIEVTALGCAICRAQKPHVDEAAEELAPHGAVLLSVDFDAQQRAARRLGASAPGTLIAFRGSEERGRSTGVANGDAIYELLARAL